MIHMADETEQEREITSEDVSIFLNSIDKNWQEKRNKLNQHDEYLMDAIVKKFLPAINGYMKERNRKIDEDEAYLLSRLIDAFLSTVDADWELDNRNFHEHEAYLVNEAKEFLQALRYRGIFPNPCEVQGELPRDESGRIDFLIVFLEALREKGWWNEEADEDDIYDVNIPKRSYYYGRQSDNFDIVRFLTSHLHYKGSPVSLNGFLHDSYTHGSESWTERDRGLLMRSLAKLEQAGKIEVKINLTEADPFFTKQNEER